MIDYTILTFTLFVLVGGAVYACACANIGGTEEAEADLQTAAAPSAIGEERSRGPRGRLIAIEEARSRRASVRR